MKRFLKDQAGITLIEILVAIAILGIIMAMHSQLLQDMIRGSARQNAIVTTQFETTLGLEIMRTDIEAAGLGLADDISGVSYAEAVSTPASSYNDATANVPRALVHNNDGRSGGAPVSYISNSDYLVIKSTAVGENAAAGKWTYINDTNAVHIWGAPDPNLDMIAGDHMIVIRPRSNVGDMAVLIADTTGTYSPPFNIIYKTAAYAAPFIPSVAGERLMAYGVDSDTNLRMPFNRADYYVRVPTNANPNCAPNTGTLYKATINQSNGEINQMPLINCVANMQVTFRLDANADAIIDTGPPVDSISTLTPIDIKQQVKEVRVYILAHEGSRDNGYQHPVANRTVYVGDTGAGQSIDLQTVVGTTWQNYRWKMYSFVVKPRSLSW